MASRPATREEIWTLHRYFLWADVMRFEFHNLFRTGGSLADNAVETSFKYPFMAYWYGGMFALIEGWTELALSDPEIDALIASPNVEPLRRYRNGAFHFQRSYFDERFLEFPRQPNAAQWIHSLREAFSRWFLDFSERDKGSDSAKLGEGESS